MLIFLVLSISHPSPHGSVSRVHEASCRDREEDEGDKMGVREEFPALLVLLLQLLPAAAVPAAVLAAEPHRKI